MTNDGTWTYSWEHGRQLASMSATDVDGGQNDVTITYTYNADGLRTGKTVTKNIYHEHSYTETVLAPTCTEGGYTTYTCTCGDSYQADETTALGHELTTETAGNDVITSCTRCDESWVSHTHSYIETVTAPTCTTSGYTTYTCPCSDSYQDNIVAALGHDLTTETVDGTLVNVCLRCGITTEAHEHEYVVTLAVPATCTSIGFTVYECFCGDTYDIPQEALGHDFPIPTSMKSVCRRCGLTAAEANATGLEATEEVQAEESVAVAENTAQEDVVTSVSQEPGTEAAPTDTNASAAETDNSERTLESTIVTEYDYVYTGDKLTQMTVTTQVDDETPTTETLYFAYDASGSPMAVTYNGTTYYYVTNLQGDVIALLNSSGTKIASYSYDAWGNPLTEATPNSYAIEQLNPLRYRGYVFDSDTRLYYLQSRYYDSELGRFINADAITSTGQGLLGNNMFAYCNNNPVCRIDATGSSFLSIVGGLFGGAVAGAAISTVSYVVKQKISGQSVTTDGLLENALCGAVIGALGAGIGMISIVPIQITQSIAITTNGLKALASASLGICVGLDSGFTSGSITSLVTFAGSLIGADGLGMLGAAFVNFASASYVGTPGEILTTIAYLLDDANYPNTNHSSSPAGGRGIPSNSIRSAHVLY